MKTIIAAAIIALSAGTASAACEWQPPSADHSKTRYTGDLAQTALEDTTMPAEARYLMADAIRNHRSADTLTIRKDRIVGENYAYDDSITDMRYAGGKVCATVSRASWAASDETKALVYVAHWDGVTYARAVPAVCGNYFAIPLRRVHAVIPAGPIEMDAPSAGGNGFRLLPLAVPQEVRPQVVTFEEASQPPLIVEQNAIPSAYTYFHPLGSITRLPPQFPPSWTHAVSPVPEPPTYALMAAGLVLIGFKAHRRQQKEAK